MGKVTALFKSGSRLDANNYRPITVLPTLSKILEKAVHSQVYGFLKTNELLSPNQFGLREKLSTAVALARFTDTILDNMDDGQLTRVAFLDLSKAFDTVNQSRLILKLKSIGFSSHVCEWFESYLEKKSLNETKSKFMLIGSHQRLKSCSAVSICINGSI